VFAFGLLQAVSVRRCARSDATNQWSSSCKAAADCWLSENLATSPRPGTTWRTGRTWARIGHDQALRANLTCPGRAPHHLSRPRSNAPLRAPASGSHYPVATLALASSSRSQRATGRTRAHTLSDLPRIVRGRPSASAGVCGDRYSFSYSPAKGRGGVAMGLEHQPRTGLGMPDVVGGS